MKTPPPPRRPSSGTHSHQLETKRNPGTTEALAERHFPLGPQLPQHLGPHLGPMKVRFLGTLSVPRDVSISVITGTLSTVQISYSGEHGLQGYASQVAPVSRKELSESAGWPLVRLTLPAPLCLPTTSLQIILCGQRAKSQLPETLHRPSNLPGYMYLWLSGLKTSAQLSAYHLVPSVYDHRPNTTSLNARVQWSPQKLDS